jgi:hypothetical protein
MYDFLRGFIEQEIRATSSCKVVISTQLREKIQMFQTPMDLKQKRALERLRSASFVVA